MEKELFTEDSEILALLPEGTFIKDYVGTYDVSYEGEVPEEGVRTLLSPESVEGLGKVSAFHFVDNAWELVEDAEVVDGFVYGTLTSFSPIAIVVSRKEIHTVENIPVVSGSYSKFVVCEGNNVQIKENDNNLPVVINTATGVEIELDVKTLVVGGAIDESIDSTNVTVIGITSGNEYLGKVISGSVFLNKEGECITLGEANLNVIDSDMGTVTGSYGAVRTNKVNFNLKNSTFPWIGAGEGYAGANTPPASFAFTAWAKEVNMNIENCTSALLYCGSNNEYFYTDKSVATVTGGHFDYIAPSSNDGMNNYILNAYDVDIDVYQSTNRGNIANAVAKFENCTVDKLFIGGDATDSSVDGTTGKQRVDINKGGTYTILPGTEAGVAITAEDVDRIVDCIKVTRYAKITIADDFKAMIGAKYIVK